MPQILFAAPDHAEYAPHLHAGLSALGIAPEIHSLDDNPAPESIDYIIYAPSSPLQDFRPFVRAKAVLSLWAGVERIVGNQTLTQPLARMVDPGMTESMVEYVVGHVLRIHLGMDQHLQNPTRIWNNSGPKLARERPVTILGFGALGQAVGRALSALHFPVTGWSNSPKAVSGMTSLHGQDGLAQALAKAEILVTLLPRTKQTENIINAQTLALLPKGAAMINPGRGQLIDDAALLDALDRKHISQAVLDVFRVEPLPKDNPLWDHPNVIVTPHIAAQTRIETAAQVLIENILRGEAGLDFLHLVNRKRGY